MDMQRAATLTEVCGGFLVREVEVCVTACTIQQADTVSSAGPDFTGIQKDN